MILFLRAPRVLTLNRGPSYKFGREQKLWEAGNCHSEAQSENAAPVLGDVGPQGQNWQGTGSRVSRSHVSGPRLGHPPARFDLEAIPAGQGRSRGFPKQCWALGQDRALLISPVALVALLTC